MDILLLYLVQDSVRTPNNYQSGKVAFTLSSDLFLKLFSLQGLFFFDENICSNPII